MERKIEKRNHERNHDKFSAGIFGDDFGRFFKKEMPRKPQYLCGFMQKAPTAKNDRGRF